MIKYKHNSKGHDLKQNTLARRAFLGTSFLLGAATLYWFNQKDKKVRLYANETQVLLHSAYHLFAHSELGLGAKDIHIASYLAFVLKDKRIMKSDRDYFLKGAYWLEESAFETYDSSFLNLSYDQKERLFQNISKERWGRNYIHTTLGYIFEALLSAPIYGSNIDGIGWKWLEHNPGFPQPQFIEEITYEV